MRAKVWSKRLAILAGLGGLALLALAATLVGTTGLGEAVTWQRQASPGRLSAAHAFLENNCAACHTGVTGVEAASCVACHASNDALLQRQPTAFHADIGSCQECHLEHRGLARRPTDMEHAALTRIGLRQWQLPARLARWLDQNNTGEGQSSLHPEITAQEAVLNCATCHANQDKHFQLFGQDCAQCHSTRKWTIPEFRHPSPRSPDCAQCHQAPPSHYMGHFRMISQKVSGKPHAQVSQCGLCHQTTSWSDIKGVGWYKHH